MPTDPIGTATVYNNYGNLLLRQFRYDDALPKYVSTRILGSHHAGRGEE